MENNERFMSDNIDQLATALAKAQAEFSIAELNQKNPFFKSTYADFESIVRASRPSLTKYGLSVVQSVYRMADGNTYLVSILLHASGQWIKSQAQHNPPKTDIQSLSSYNTYLKRMCYSSLVGVVTGDVDDDGEASMIRSNDVNYKSFVLTLPSERQQKICTHYNVNSINELTLDQCKEIYAKVNIK